MKRFSLVLVIAVVCLASVFAVDFNKNKATFTLSPFSKAWIHPLDDQVEELAVDSKYGVSASAGFEYKCAKNFGLELSAQASGFYFDTFYWYDGSEDFVLDLLARAVVTLPLGEKAAALFKVGCGADGVFFFRSYSWHFLADAEVDLTFGLSSNVSFLVGYEMNCDFQKSQNALAKSYTLYMMPKIGVISYL